MSRHHDRPSKRSNNRSSVESVVFRVSPGEDLVQAIRNVVRKGAYRAVSVASCVGSLSSATLRMANADKNNKNEIKRRSCRFEIVSLVGTAGYDPSSQSILQHFHLALADAEGGFFGGHCMSSSSESLLPVFTTAEVTLLIHRELVFSRTPDVTTGFKELRVDRAV